MMTEFDDILQRLRGEAGDPVPTDEDRRAARARLDAAITAERGYTRRTRALRWFTAAAALVAVAAGSLWVLGVGRTPAVASLEGIARAARQAGPLDVPDGAFLYVRAEETSLTVRPGSEFGLDVDWLPYLLPTTTETWTGPAGRFVQIRTTIGTPRFFDPAAEVAYRTTGGGDADRVGQTATERFTDVTGPYHDITWSTNAETLVTQIDAVTGSEDQRRPARERRLDVVLDLLRDPLTEPELRGALIETFALLGPNEITPESDSSTTLTFLTAGERPTRIQVTITSTGWPIGEHHTLLGDDTELDIPAGTIIYESHREPPQLVDQLPDP